MSAVTATSTADTFTVGVDFGTLSGRAVVVRVRDGEEIATAVFTYPDAVIDRRLPGTRERLPADWALQNPADWVRVLQTAVPDALAAAAVPASAVIALGTDFTSSTVLPTDRMGRPLCQLAEFAGRPHAWPKLWKHHAAQPHADRINALAEQRKETWLARYGGRISAEWQFAKALQLLQDDPEIYRATARWIEASDWIVWQLTGQESRNAGAAGYKGIHQDGTYPSREFLAALDPDFADFAETRLEHPLSPLAAAAGRLTATAAAWTGLPGGIVVAVGNIDAHVSAAAADAVRPGQLLAVTGTSTCHVMPAAELVEVAGMCGVVDGGIVAGLFGYEAGQSAVGDIFAWWVDHHVPDRYRVTAEARGESIHQYLSELTADAPVGAHGLVALDWMNGNRSVLVDHELSGVVVGLTLATRPEEIYRALLEATAFGTRRIVDAFDDAGIPVREFVVAGGLIANPVLLQIYADALGRPLSIAGTRQGAALGSAIHAAVAAGAYPDVTAAAAAMGRVHRDAYRPDPDRAAAYDRLYEEYLRLHDYFGRSEAEGGNEVLHRLRVARNAARR